MAVAGAEGRIECDVVIAGGGLVGLTLGTALAGAGIETAVVDGTPPATMRDAVFDGRVSSIALGSKRVLDGIGLWPALADDAQPILEIRVTDGDAPLFLHYDHKAVGEDPLGFIVENRTVRAALLERATAQASLHHLAPASVEDLDPSGGAVEAALADGRRVRARLAIAADGARSRLRSAAGIETVRWSYEQVGIVCTVAHERPHRGIAHERFLPAGPFAILPMTDNRSSLVWTERAELAPSLLEASPAAFARELALRFGTSSAPWSRQVRAGAIRSHSPMRSATSRRASRLRATQRMRSTRSQARASTSVSATPRCWPSSSSTERGLASTSARTTCSRTISAGGASIP